MVVQSGNTGGAPVVSIWLSKAEFDDKVLQEIINEIKKKYKVCTYRSGQAQSEGIYRKIIVDNALK